jgi:hypothetical protein
VTKKTDLQISEAALQSVCDERAREINEEGYTRAHDDEHVNGQLATAAISYVGYALRLLAEPPQYFSIEHLIDVAPWPIRAKLDQRDCLVKAAALIVAEIERLDRAAQ